MRYNMKIIGIIIEANPLHHGHEHLINTVKNEHSPDCLVAVVSTYFTMRGDINCVTKKEKINQLLDRFYIVSSRICVIRIVNFEKH